MSLRRHTLSVSRPVQSSIGADGSIVKGTPTTFSILTSVQPMNKEQQLSNPFLRDFKEVYTLFTSRELYTARAGVHEADQVTIFGESFEVVTVQRWRNEIKPHYQVAVAR